MVWKADRRLWIFTTIWMSSIRLERNDELLLSVVALLGAKVHDVKTADTTKYGHLYTNVMTLLQPTITRKSYVFQPASSIVLN